MKVLSQYILSLFVFNGLASIGLAQGLAYDGTVSGGALTGPSYVVPQNAGVTAGSNLLHSFARFNVGTGESVTFTGAGVSNILARVTGGEISQINGLIRSDIASANLFLLNPAGVMIGEGAKIDISGSFNVSTADYLKLADGREFRASASGDLTLLSAPPQAFGFLSNPAGGDIEVRRPGDRLTFSPPGRKFIISGSLDAANQNIRVVARNLRVYDSRIVTEGGDVVLMAQGAEAGEILIDNPVGGSGEIDIINTNINVGWVDGGRILAGGGIIIVEGEGEIQRVELNSGIVTSRNSDGLNANGASSGQAGQINFHASDLIEIRNSRIHASGRDSSSAGRIVLDAVNEISVLDGSIISADVESLSGGSGAAGEIVIRGGGLTVDGLDSALNTHIHANTSLGISGDAGLVSVDVLGSVNLLNGGNLTANSFGSGNAGRIRVNAGGLEVRGGNSNAFTGIFAGALLDTGNGSGGIVNVDIAGDAMISNRGWIGAVTDGSGDAGSIVFRSNDLTIRGAEDLGLYDNEFLTGIIGIPFSGTDAEGRGAEIDVRVASTLRLERGGQIDSSTFGGGDAGNVYVEAGTIRADRGGSRFFTGIGSDTDAGMGAGNAGSVTVGAGKIELLNGAHISSSTAGFGNAGDISVIADEIMIAGAGVDSDFVPAANSGIIALTKAGSVGFGGNIRVISPSVILESGGQIDSSTSGAGDAGSVYVEAGTILANRRESQFFTGIGSNTGEGAGNAGRVDVKAGHIELRDGAHISSSAFGIGNAGDISVFADEIIISGEGVESGFVPAQESGIIALTKSESVGEGGDVSVNSPYVMVDRDGLISAQSDGTGDGGLVTITAGEGILDVINGGRVSARSEQSGISGGVVVSAGYIQLAQGGVIESLNTGTGVAGTVRLEAALGLGIDNGTIAVSALNADVGQIELVLGGDLIVRNGLLTADAGADGGGLLIEGGRLLHFIDTEVRAEAVDNGGNISILGGEYLVLNRSNFSANAINGNGGIIDLQTGVFFSNSSVITAISQFGNDGTVQINPDLSLSNNEKEMDNEPLDESDELQPECTQRLATKEGSFTQAGRGGSQRLPGGYLPSMRLLK